MRSLAAAALFSLLLALGARAHAAGNAQAGHELARRWCSSCHTVDNAGPAKDVAPSFPGVAQRNANNHGWVRAWLTAPHPPMPNLNLSRQQIDDVIAYLDSLAPPAR